MVQAPTGKEFTTEVFPAELSEIYQRRKALGIDTGSIGAHVEGVEERLKTDLADASKPTGFRHLMKGLRHPKHAAGEKTAQFQTGVKPSTEFGLVGLAISGGGIRSATFSLGVLQGLARRDLLRFVDYMSTVSGGGYIGSCLSSVLNQPETLSEDKERRSEQSHIGPENFPFKFQPGTEKPPLKYLRQHAKYLDQGSSLSVGLIPALVVRGILVNLLVLIPAVVAFALITDLVELWKNSLFWWWSPYLITGVVTGLFILWCLFYPWTFRRWRKVEVDYSRRRFHEETFLIGMVAVLFTAAVETLPAIMHLYHRTGVSEYAPRIWAAAGAAIAAISGLLSYGKLSEWVSKFAGKVLIAVAGLLGPAILFAMYLQLADFMTYHNQNRTMWYIVLGTGLLIYVYSWWVDVNSTSLHGFYRDRLSETFLFRCNAGDCIESSDSLKLSNLNLGNAPYHLINVTLNLAGSENPELHGRSSDFFILAKQYCGSHRTGYVRTKLLETKEPHLNLGTAMAISGAAAAPNMGTSTIKPLVFLMAMLNIRLGYWLPNPHAVKSDALLHKLYPNVGPAYLLLEMLGRMKETDAFVNLSDGGHLENLGVYELLRRRCKYIIAIDAEADHAMDFPSLARVMRYARIDMGIRIEIDVGDMRRAESGWSASHCTIAKIDYGDGEIGHLLYIKSSVTGDEMEYVKQYKATHAAFPHESTADQFFDEAQFEAYRSLGHHVFESVFNTYQERPASIEDWFEDLQRGLRPRYSRRAEFAEAQSQLMSISERFQDPDVAPYTYEIFPELTPANYDPTLATDESERRRKIFHLCDSQIQLMENIYMTLQLEVPKNREDYQNRGWMNLFRRWAQAPTFQRSWAVTVSTYSDGFQRFCEDALQLRYSIRWRLGKPEEQELQPDRHHFIRLYDNDQLWVADMCIETTAGRTEKFPVGLAFIRPQIAKPPLLVYYCIREYYQKMRLLESMMKVLPVHFSQGIRIELPPAHHKFTEFFKKHGFIVEMMTEVPRRLTMTASG